MSARSQRRDASPSHIFVDDEGVAWIDDTGVKVVEVVLDEHANGWSAEEIHFQHRDLSLAQIHAALSWYYDHQDEVDREIARRLDEADALARDAAAHGSPLRARLRRLGRLG